MKETVPVTLHYLCTGDSQFTIGTSYRISPTTIGRIISETSRAIWYVPNKKGFIKAPTSKKERLDIATKFDNKWNFPHCLVAINGKHLIKQTPPRKCYSFFNYRKSLSIGLLAVCNTNCSHLFILVNLVGKAMEESSTTLN